MNKTEQWDHYRGVIRTRKGGWRIGKVVLSHGYSMMDDLVGKVSFFQTLVLNCTGRLPEKRLADWLEALFICTSWPDPRIWCNQIGALAGSARTSPVTAVVAGLQASDSRMYGIGVVGACCEFIDYALAHRDLGVAELVTMSLSERSQRGQSKPALPGYARPLATGDERVVAMRRVSTELGFEPGEREQLALSIHQHLVEHYQEAINIGGYLTAFLRDQDLTTDEIINIYTTFGHAGIIACYADTVTRPSGTFMAMRCTDIDYRGPPPRELPKFE